MQGPLIETVKSDEVREYETFISSEWADVRKTFESINPYMGKVWARVRRLLNTRKHFTRENGSPAYFSACFPAYK
jgi:hypothetical protein